MKRKAKKLTLSRETLDRLDSEDLSRVAGGQTNTYPQNTCPCPTNTCPSANCSGKPLCGDV
ncbi:MAG TPA: TIGR04149 family rSAM-modified RiPP [Thermoanaerobaculia bacterium]|jgi:natural product precursor|nr:TIGR04149 family rSAM-modified RiPP [Thermoanaerobaculia bacterium]